MRLLKTVAAWTEMVKLFLDPPSLFHHLHSLAWYRGALLESMPILPNNLAGKSVLEIGCATGDFCGDMSALGAAVCGIDRSRDMVNRARITYDSVQFEIADAMALPYGDHKFDVVFAASLLNVVSDPPKVLREMARVSRTGGALALLVPEAQFNTANAKAWVSKQGLSVRESAFYMAWHRLAKKIHADQITRWMIEAGLESARIETRHLLGGLVRVVHVFPIDFS